MKKGLLFFSLILFSLNMNAQTDAQMNQAAQEAERKAKMEASMKLEDKEGWVKKAGIGLDLGQLINVNPYIGGGSNRIGIGGAIAYSANYKRNLLKWKNDINFNLSTQRIGSGIIASGSDQRIPFEKALDIFTVGSNLAYQVKENSPWAYSADFLMISQLLPSHVDSASKKTYLSPTNEGVYNTTLVSKLFNPANITLAPGIKYQKSKNWYAFLSPSALKLIYVADQNIANLGVHGTKKKENSNEYEKSQLGLGAMARVGYSNKFFKRLNYTSELILYSNYLNEPQNIDVNWFNTIGIEIFKGFNLQFKADAFYDHDKLNSITDADAIGGLSAATGRRVNIIQQLLLTYNRNF
jgi:hypothetical protein